MAKNSHDKQVPQQPHDIHYAAPEPQLLAGAVVSCVLGLFSFFMSICCICSPVALPIGACAWLLGMSVRRKIYANEPKYAGEIPAIVGMVLGMLAVIFSLLMITFGVIQGDFLRFLWFGLF